VEGPSQERVVYRAQHIAGLIATALKD